MSISDGDRGLCCSAPQLANAGEQQLQNDLAVESSPVSSQARPVDPALALREAALSFNKVPSIFQRTAPGGRDIEEVSGDARTDSLSQFSCLLSFC